MLTVYYAHPKFMYGTEYEKRDLEVIRKYFPKAKITNPAKIRYKHGRFMPVYEHFASLHDVIVYRPVAGKFITAGVYEEIEAGFWKGIKVLRLSEDDGKVILEDINKLREYPLSPKFSAIVGKIWKCMGESHLRVKITDLTSKYQITPACALILLCTKFMAEEEGVEWLRLLKRIKVKGIELSVSHLIKIARNIEKDEMENIIRLALAEVLEGSTISFAAKKYGVNYSTLHNKVRKIFPDLRKRPSAKSPTEIQKQIILGCLLGDGKFNILSHYGKHYKGATVVISHTPADRNYVWWKYKALKELSTGEPRLQGKKKVSLTFYVRANDFTRKIRHLGPHPLTSQFLKYIRHPIALAIWYCDDGSYTKSSLQISTESFSKEENLLFIEWLREKWGIDARLSKHGKYWRLILPKEQAIKFLNLTKGYVSKAMPRKLPPWFSF